MVGKGAFGIVRLGVHKKTGERAWLSRSFRSATRRIGCCSANWRHCSASNAAVVTSMSSISRVPTKIQSNFYLVTELVSGGELFEHLVGTARTQKEAARLLREVACALKFLHEHGITHGDLKPENLVLSETGRENAHVKLIDFGCAVTEGADEQSLHEQELGTPAYAAPELLVDNVCSPAADVWALGVIMYTMLAGMHPFSDSFTDKEEMVDAICNRPIDFTDKVWSAVSDSAKHLIQQLTQKDASVRYSIDDVLAHPWIRGETASDTVLAGSDARLSEFNLARQKLRAQVLRLLVKKAALRRMSRNPRAQRRARAGPGLEPGLEGSGSGSGRRDEPPGQQVRACKGGRTQLAYPSTADRRTITPMSKELQVVTNAFQLFDREKKGYISREDLRAAMEEVGEGVTSESELEQIINNAALASSAESCEYEDYNAVMAELAQVHYKEGDVIFEQGDKAHNFYFISSGEVEVVAKVGAHEARLGTLAEGEYFGEQAMLSEARRNATVRCLTPVTLITLGKDDFQALMGSHGGANGLHASVKSEAESRSRGAREDPRRHDGQHLRPDRARDVRRGRNDLPRGRLRRLHVLDHQGQGGRHGQGCARRQQGRRQAVASLHEGDVFGERALMAGEERNATVHCASPECELAVLRKKAFMKMMKTTPEAQQGMMTLRKQRTFKEMDRRAAQRLHIHIVQLYIVQ